MKNNIFHNFWKHMFLTVGHFDFHFSNEKGLPAKKKKKNKKKNILEYWVMWAKGKDTCA